MKTSFHDSHNLNVYIKKKKNETLKGYYNIVINCLTNQLLVLTLNILVMYFT